MRREGLSNILLKELPLEGYVCEKYSKIGRYIALEKFKLNLIVMELTKARFSNESMKAEFIGIFLGTFTADQLAALGGRSPTIRLL